MMKQRKSRGDISRENGEQQEIKLNRRENIDLRREYILFNGFLSDSYIKLILHHFLFAVAWSPYICQNFDTSGGFYT
jgi:hypothetical protein